MNKKYFQLFAAWALILFTACACRGLFKNYPAGVPARQTVAQDQWDRAFSRKSGWTGGDVGSSFLIPGNRVLWVFGDSFVGDVEADRHLRAVMVNNSIAVHAYHPDWPGKAPMPGGIKFYWGPPDASGKPSAWVKPFEDSKSWYWPTGGGVVFPGVDGGQRLALFLIQLEKIPADNSVWGFEVVGGAVAIVDNIEDPAEKWKPRVRGISYVAGRMEWGEAALMDTRSQGSPGYIYIYGTEMDPSDKRDLLLARVPSSKLEQTDHWEFFAGGGQWLNSPDQALPIVKGVASELSVDRIADRTGGVHYVMVYSEPFPGNRIFVRAAPNPEGPWSEAQPVFTVSGVKGSKTLFAYAAKGHAPLSEPGSLLISYIVNSNDFKELVNNASIYRPRFVAAPLKAVELR